MKIWSTLLAIIVLLREVLLKVDADGMLPDFTSLAHDHQAVFFVCIQVYQDARSGD